MEAFIEDVVVHIFPDLSVHERMMWSSSFCLAVAQGPHDSNIVSANSSLCALNNG